MKRSLKKRRNNGMYKNKERRKIKVEGLSNPPPRSSKLQGIVSRIQQIL